MVEDKYTDLQNNIEDKFTLLLDLPLPELHLKFYHWEIKGSKSWKTISTLVDVWYVFLASAAVQDF